MCCVDKNSPYADLKIRKVQQEERGEMILIQEPWMTENVIWIKNLRTCKFYSQNFAYVLSKIFEYRVKDFSVYRNVLIYTSLQTYVES